MCFQSYFSFRYKIGPSKVSTASVPQSVRFLFMDDVVFIALLKTSELLVFDRTSIKDPKFKINVDGIILGKIVTRYENRKCLEAFNRLLLIQ